ncbi:MAG: D-alanyl-D-alanine carboxypeptidase [Micavibrio sp.]|mgnify:CR=1 FL=1|nr:D-alanyl-D-alanine carboxypeptidase [Micavibrio sp.]|tara:strand:- start:42 stop:1505 length:1464 start_codon:yes stop_codon:yes gene_type:complete
MTGTQYKFRIDRAPNSFSRILKNLFLVSALVALIVPAYTHSANARSNPRYASIVVDFDTGLVLSERYADKKLHPASLTKAMTLMMMFDAINSGRVGLKDRIRMSKHAASMVPSKLNIPIGSTIRVEDAIYALVTKSANDVAAAMAEHLGGTESNFAKMMTAKARQIGMKNTRFMNASGLHNPRQVSTARDMAIMARTMINDYPGQYKYFSKRYFTYQGKTYRNHNRLMESYKGMDGLKTGYVSASGFNLVASAVQNNHRLIGVVFGGRSTSTRNAHMANILDNGFEKIGQIKVAAFRNVPVPKPKPALLQALASLNAIAPAAAQKGSSQWANLNTSLQNGMFGRLVGEGDIDPAASNRIETGLMAIAAHKGEAYKAPARTQAPNRIQPARIKVPSGASDSTRLTSINQAWAIQIGAFTSRAQTDKALGQAVLKLPEGLRNGQPVIVPTKKGNGWLFRARLNGYSEAQALAACRYLKDCIPVHPNVTR